MSQTTSLLSNSSGSARIPPGVLAYLGERARNNCYDFVIRKFRSSGLTKAELARRLGKGADRINHLLASPGNWTVDTMAELLAGIAGEEFVPASASFSGRAQRNVTQADILSPRRDNIDKGGKLAKDVRVEWKFDAPPPALDKIREIESKTLKAEPVS
jgi:hypothetical protein